MKTRSNDDNSCPDPLPQNTQPECASADASLHRRLDGETAQEPDDVRRHRAVCDRCRSYEEAALLLVKGLRSAKAEQLPADLVERVLQRWHAEPALLSRRRYRYVAAAFALAASVAIAVVAIIRSTGPGDPPVAVAPPAPIQSAAAPTPLDESIDEAASAVSSLTRKAADDALNIKLPTIKLPSSGPLERLEPAVASMQNFGQNAVFSVAPITHSARRAVDMFWREIGPESESGADMN
jgi:hypothetical protein